MAQFTWGYSIVLVGGLNPQILSHDFLLKHDLLPKSVEPFATLLREEPPFTSFVSTPPVCTLEYGPISLLVTPERFQAKHDHCEEPAASPVIELTKSYFERCLPQTPLNAAGINQSGVIRFSSDQDESEFDKRVGIDKQSVVRVTGDDKTRAGISFSYTCENTAERVSIRKQRDSEGEAMMTLNSELKADGLATLVHLENVGAVCARFVGFLKAWSVEQGQVI